MQASAVRKIDSTLRLKAPSSAAPSRRRKRTGGAGILNALERSVAYTAATSMDTSRQAAT